jgi:poly(3-hydroxybutyrate) depolymerase
MDRAVDEAGYYRISTQQGKDRYIADIEALVEAADRAAAELFDLRPQGEVIVIGGQTGGYYVPGAPDGTRPGSYHVSLVGDWRPRYSMPTIAYHEAIPGHHFQIALAQEMDLPLFQTDVVFNAYAEGWAMYAERLAWELGLYDDDPYGNLGRLQYELLRAVRLVTDTGIHAMGWTRDEARAYMDEAIGAPPGRFSHEVDRYIVLPAQATGYKIGLIKMLELRQRAMDQLGDQFDIKEFHNVVLGHGSVPLDILERVVQGYIDAKSAPSLTGTLTPMPTTAPAPSLTPPASDGKYQKPGNYIDAFSVHGVDRWFTVHLPPDYVPGVPMPLVLNLHGYSSDPFAQEVLSGMNAKADEEGFIVVNPQALNNPPSWRGPLPGEEGQRDRDFFHQLIPFLQQQISIDTDRIYATGMSNGGTMSYRLACDMSGTLAAIAPVSGGWVGHHLCEPEDPISVLVIHGTDDQVIPYHGNEADSPSVHVWLETWAQHNDCDPTPSVSQPFESVTLESWTGCTGETSVRLYTLEGGGHTWPGAPLGSSSGASFPYMDATNVIWDFFASHPKVRGIDSVSSQQ